MWKVSDQIKVYQSAFWQLNSTICNHERTSIVWDPAYSDKEIDDIFVEAVKDRSSEKYLIYTHGDYDHIVGTAQFEEFKKLGSLPMDLKTNKAAILNQIAAIDSEFYLERMHPIQFPQLDKTISGSNEICEKLGSLEVVFYQAGGHTSDGLFTILPELGLWVAGDYLSDIEFPFIEDRIEEYYKTLNKASSILEQYKIEFMVPGHGSPAFTPSTISSRIAQSLRYLDSFLQPDIVDWRVSWGESPFGKYLDKMHRQNIQYVRP